MTLLDTDTLSLLMGGNEGLTQHLERADEVAIPVITRIEVLQGRFASILKAANGEELLRAQHWLERNEQYMRGLPVVGIDGTAAAEFDKLRTNKKLKKIGPADLLIAAIALAHRATLVTRNMRHFQEVPGLKVEDWTK